MKKVTDLFEAKATRKKSVIFTFGRFNPMTSGHEKLIKHVVKTASRLGLEHRIYPSHSQDAKKNPLSHSKKVKYMKRFFPYANIVNDKNARTPFHVAAQLNEQGYTHVILVVGGDRVSEFRKLFTQYINHPDPKKRFNFEKFDVISAGRRDPDADDISGMSASKMRGLVAAGNYDKFLEGLPEKASEKDALSLYNDLRRGMNIKESFEEINELTRLQRMKISRTARRTANRRQFTRKRKQKRRKNDEELKAKARKAAYMLIRRRFLKGRNWNDLSIAEKETIDTRMKKINPKRIERIATKILPIVRRKEQERLEALRSANTTNEAYVRDYKKEYAKYHGTPEQIKRRAARVKARRELTKQGKVSLGDNMDVDHIDGDPTNNDLKNLRVVDRNFNRSRDNNKWRVRSEDRDKSLEAGTPETRKAYADEVPGQRKSLDKLFKKEYGENS
jgi:hypothetical protein